MTQALLPPGGTETTALVKRLLAYWSYEMEILAPESQPSDLGRLNPTCKADPPGTREKHGWGEGRVATGGYNHLHFTDGEM